MRRILAATVLLAGAALVGSTDVVRAQAGPVVGDINGDGGADLVVGVPLEEVNGNDRAGSINIIFSNGRKLARAGNVAVSQRGPVPGAAEDGDLFGSAVGLADVDGDGFADVLVGASGETVGQAANAGALYVIPGSADGVDVDRAQVYTQGGALPGASETGDFFGYNVAAGDFDGDGFADAVVSAPFEEVDGVPGAGSLTVIPGSADGLDTARATHHTQGPGLVGTPAASEVLGWALATGDFDGDGFDDLAAGAPGEDRAGAENAGAVVVMYGSSTGLDPSTAQMVSQAGRIKNSPEDDDLFGFSLASSDMDCDGRDDLLVGVPNETLGSGNVVAGLVNVIMGTADGLTADGNRRLVEGKGGVAGERDFNQFGAALAAGDFDGDGCGDIAISAHTTDIGGTGVGLCVEDPGCVRQAGAVVIVYGTERWSPNRVGGTGFFSQRGPLADSPERNDFFGRTLTALDVNGDGADELVIGIPREDVAGRRDAGKVTVLRGRDGGLRADRDYSFSQRGTIKGAPEAGDRFGSSLAGSIS